LKLKILAFLLLITVPLFAAEDFGAEGNAWVAEVRHLLKVHNDFDVEAFFRKEEATARKLLSINPDSPENKRRLADALHMQGHFVEYRLNFEAARALHEEALVLYQESGLKAKTSYDGVLHSVEHIFIDLFDASLELEKQGNANAAKAKLMEALKYALENKTHALLIKERFETRFDQMTEKIEKLSNQKTAHYIAGYGFAFTSAEASEILNEVEIMKYRYRIQHMLNPHDDIGFFDGMNLFKLDGKGNAYSVFAANVDSYVNDFNLLNDRLKAVVDAYKNERSRIGKNVDSELIKEYRAEIERLLVKNQRTYSDILSMKVNLAELSLQIEFANKQLAKLLLFSERSQLTLEESRKLNSVTDSIKQSIIEMKGNRYRAALRLKLAQESLSEFKKVFETYKKSKSVEAVMTLKISFDSTGTNSCLRVYRGSR
jgi:hypothetical protein